MGIYKNWKGKSSGSAPKLQEKFPDKVIPNNGKIGKKWKKILSIGKKKVSDCQKFLKLEIFIKSWLGFLPGTFRALSSARDFHEALWHLLCPGKIPSEMNDPKQIFDATGPSLFPQFQEIFNAP